VSIPATGEAFPDHTGADLEEVLKHVAHPVLSEILAGLLVRSCHPEQAVAYFDDSPRDWLTEAACDESDRL
jgi:hypothetical protein